MMMEQDTSGWLGLRLGRDHTVISISHSFTNHTWANLFNIRCIIVCTANIRARNKQLFGVQEAPG